jgi:hypothetical protein
MRSLPRGAFLALALLLVASIPLAAQKERRGIRVVDHDERHGFWGVLALGAGTEQVNFDGDDLGWSDAITRPTGALRLGGTINEHVRLGGEAHGWFNDEDAITETVGALLLVAQFYPWARSGLFLKGGLGYAGSTIEDDFGFESSDGGFAGQLGVGYDIRLGRRIFLVPTLDFNGYRFGDEPDGYSERIAALNIGIAYQH